MNQLPLELWRSIANLTGSVDSLELFHAPCAGDRGEVDCTLISWTRPALVWYLVRLSSDITTLDELTTQIFLALLVLTQLTKVV